jgi:hypothetical protein
MVEDHPLDDPAVVLRVGLHGVAESSARDGLDGLIEAERESPVGLAPES